MLNGRGHLLFPCPWSSLLRIRIFGVILLTTTCRLSLGKCHILIFFVVQARMERAAGGADVLGLPAPEEGQQARLVRQVQGCLDQNKTLSLVI
jgi:hypothetical protein